MDTIMACAAEKLNMGYENRNIYILSDGKATIKADSDGF
jgi:hypothetical protein